MIVTIYFILSNEGAIVIIDNKYIRLFYSVVFIVRYLCQNSNMVYCYSTYTIKISCTVLIALHKFANLPK